MKKNVFFYSKKTSQPRKKLKFCMKKSQKNDKKRYQKDHPAPQKLKFCKKKFIFFTQKYHPSSQKTEVLIEKKNKLFLFIFFWFFLFIFLLDFFSWSKKNWDSFYNRSKKNEVLHDKFKIVIPMGILKKKSRPPTSPNFLACEFRNVKQKIIIFCEAIRILRQSQSLSFSLRPFAFASVAYHFRLNLAIFSYIVALFFAIGHSIVFKLWTSPKKTAPDPCLRPSER